MAIALVCAGLTLQAATAAAYVPNGKHWPLVAGAPSTVVKIYLDDSLTG